MKDEFDGFDYARVYSLLAQMEESVNKVIELRKAMMA